MNILESEESYHLDSREIKLKYLQLQNQWCGDQLHKFAYIISQYKQILELSSKQDNEKLQKAFEKLKSLNQTIALLVSQTIQKGISSAEIERQELEIGPLMFLKLILSFQQHTRQIRDKNMLTERQLQKLQSEKKVNICIQSLPKPDSTFSINSIDSYDIYPKIYQNYKRRIIDLKIKRNSLESQLLNLDHDSKKEIESLSSTVESYSCWKSIRNGTQFDTERMVRKKKEELTSFEQTLLLFKKKKFTNRKLKQKIRFLKHCINDKSVVIEKLRLINDEKVWEYVEMLQDQEGQFFIDSNVSSISIMNQSANSKEFDVDLSKIVNPKKLKTFESYSVERNSNRRLGNNDLKAN